MNKQTLSKIGTAILITVGILLMDACKPHRKGQVSDLYNVHTNLPKGATYYPPIIDCMQCPDTVVDNYTLTDTFNLICGEDTIHFYSTDTTPTPHMFTIGDGYITIEYIGSRKTVIIDPNFQMK